MESLESSLRFQQSKQQEKQGNGFLKKMQHFGQRGFQELPSCWQTGGTDFLDLIDFYSSYGKYKINADRQRNDQI